jgi:hypothetical protein
LVARAFAACPVRVIHVDLVLDELTDAVCFISYTNIEQQLVSKPDGGVDLVAYFAANRRVMRREPVSDSFVCRSVLLQRCLRRLPGAIRAPRPEASQEQVMTKTTTSLPLTISLQDPNLLDARTGLRGVHPVNDLRDALWQCYGLQLLDEYRDQLQPAPIDQVDKAPRRPTVLSPQTLRPDHPWRPFTASFLCFRPIAPFMRSSSQPSTDRDHADLFGR